MTARQLAGALFVSAAVHAAAAVTLGGVRGSAYPLERTTTPADVDVAIVVNTQADARAPRAAPGTATPAHKAPRSTPAARPAVTAAAVTAVPARFMLSAGTVATHATTAAAVPTTAGPSAAPPNELAAFGEGDVTVPARLLAASPLAYPPAARQAELEQDVPVDIVVDASGRVVSAHAAVRAAGYGLDDAAVRAIRNYRFSPAMRDGRPVAVRMRWTVHFQLR